MIPITIDMGKTLLIDKFNYTICKKKKKINKRITIKFIFLICNNNNLHIIIIKLL